jgi:tetratricopeptide (TPR) repeat protein
VIVDDKSANRTCACGAAHRREARCGVQLNRGACNFLDGALPISLGFQLRPPAGIITDQYELSYTPPDGTDAGRKTMGKFYAKASMILVFMVCGSQAGDLRAWEQEQAVKRRARQQVTAVEAKALEEGLKTKPDNLGAREKLITYYFKAMLTSRAPELEERREQHVFWLIEHHPDCELAGSPEAGLDFVVFSQSTEGYQRGKQLWLQQVELHPDNLRIVRNAARFFSLWDRKLGRELFEKALMLDPSDAQASSMLAQSYMNERLMVESPEEKVALAEKALSIRERALEKVKGDQRFYALGDMATEALEAGDAAKAEQYASELLQSAQQFKNDWNYGNAVHKGNIVLGRVALRRSDMRGAKQRLLAAGETPGSPQLDSFGPNMTLAKELLEKGEREVVLAYLQSCAKFWKMGGDKLQDWIATVKAGGVPDFGGNLLY